MDMGGAIKMWKVLSPRCSRESAEVLQEFLNVRYPLFDSSRNVSINWGNSSIERSDIAFVFGNKREAVARSANKEVFFSLCNGLSTVPVVTKFTKPGVFQHSAYLSDGRGVSYVDKASDFIPGLLSTKRIKGEEYRVYFCYDMKPLIYRKVKMDDGAPDNAIQCSTNGYGYTTTLKPIRGLVGVLESLTKAVADRLELSMGAVDFIVDKEGYCWVLESNSAPTLFLDTIADKFAESISRRFDNV